MYKKKTSKKLHISSRLYSLLFNTHSIAPVLISRKKKKIKCFNDSFSSFYLQREENKKDVGLGLLEQTFYLIEIAGDIHVTRYIINHTLTLINNPP